MRISIVIPTFNEERLLAQTVAHVNSLRPVFTAADWESELIVCDNNSTDGRIPAPLGFKVHGAPHDLKGAPADEGDLNYRAT